MPPSNDALDAFVLMRSSVPRLEYRAIERRSFSFEAGKRRIFALRSNKTSPSRRTEMPIDRPDAIRLIFLFHAELSVARGAPGAVVSTEAEGSWVPKPRLGAPEEMSRVGSPVAMVAHAGTTREATSAHIKRRISRVWSSGVVSSRYLPDLDWVHGSTVGKPLHAERG